MDENSIADFLKKTNVFAVIGVSRDPEKYGHQVYRDLRNAGYKVYCINPNANRVLGDKCYKSLEVLQAKPDVVDVVVSSTKDNRTSSQGMRETWIRKVWMQHGSESEETINFCRKNGIAVVHGVCVMIERKSGFK